jgi:hypothetical protein
MQKAKSILLLFIIGVLVFPWGLIDFCVTHPTGHKHHHHEPGKPTPCELRKQSEGTAYWPPMDCRKFSVSTDDYQAPDKFQIKPTYQTLAVVAVLLELVTISFPKEPFLFPPEPKCRSATIISVNALRGPPLV